MAIYETYSKRMKRLRQQGEIEVYQYDSLPEAFRNQVVHIWLEVMPPADEGIKCERDWENLHNLMAREVGVVTLDASDDDEWRRFDPARHSPGPFTRCASFLVKGSVEDALDIIEVTFKWMDQNIRGRGNNSWCSRLVDRAISELNHRFREHGIGYQFEKGKLIRIDSQFIHAEIVKPALWLLHETGFKGAEEEFLKAHEHYRLGDTKAAMVEALKAFESTMKAICDARGWSYLAGATAKGLLDVLFSNQLIPLSLQSHFTALRSTLEAGLPTLRNKNAGHGQGANSVKVPDFLAAYALHLAATNLVMLLQAHKAGSEV